ncbi:DNA polymerase II [Halobacteriales archaeon QS_3_64_16]|nr:MAG: DNA polymerase II [Halobacteriales archaeon QS_3_64_16]
MSPSPPVEVVRELTSRGYNANREAVTLLARTSDPAAAISRALDAAPEETLTLSAEHVRSAVDTTPDRPNEEAAATTTNGDDPATDGGNSARAIDPTDPISEIPLASDGASIAETTATTGATDATETAAPGTAAEGDSAEPIASDPAASSGDTAASDAGQTKTPVETEGFAPRDAAKRSLQVANDMTGRSTGTGEYGDFVRVFRDRYERLSRLLRPRVKHRPIEAIRSMPGGAEVAIVGLISDIRSTRNGHRLVELEDTTGTFPCLFVTGKEVSERIDELLYDEAIAIEGTLSDDAGICFVDELYFPDVPRTNGPSRADRHVRAALVSDVHVGSQEFRADAWSHFADWLGSEEAERVEYLLLAGDMVEGVGVYPGQDEELDVLDIYEQYELFSEYLKEVPGDVEIVMIPGNHDAVRLAEPQPGFEDDLREIMSAHDARVTSNPSLVTIEGVSVLMYHGVSLDEVIAELPEEKASYDHPHRAMTQLLKKRHVAPQYGGHTRLAPEDRDYLVMDDVPDVFHTGHVHKLGYGKHRNVLSINSGCWQDQTAFQKRVNIEPDVGYAPIVDLDTLDLTIQKFT